MLVEVDVGAVVSQSNRAVYQCFKITAQVWHRWRSSLACQWQELEGMMQLHASACLSVSSCSELSEAGIGLGHRKEFQDN